MAKFYFLPIALLIPICTHAQVFTERLRQQRDGQGRLVIIQDSILDQIINNTKISTSTSARGSHPVKQKQQPQKKVETIPARKQESYVQTHKTEEESKVHEEAKARVVQEARQKTERLKTARDLAAENNVYIARARYQATGFRIQVYTGGNSRNDKAKAQQLQMRCRQAFPELSAYVHFISRHWVCRVGDFKDRNEAQRYASQIRRKKLSYEVRIVKSTVLLAR